MKISNKDLDLGLVKRAKAGDYQAFDLLVLKYQSRLISTAFKFVKDLQIAEDLVQDSFIKSFKSIGSFIIGLNGLHLSHLPLLDMGVRNTVQFSTEIFLYLAKISSLPMTLSARSKFSQTPKMA